MASSRRAEIAAKVIAHRRKLWPDRNEKRLWSRHTSDGFATVPRTMPIIMRILDEMSKNAPLSAVYFELWCRAFDESFVNLSKSREMAYHAAFTGARSERTWRDRMRKLRDLGFIEIAPGPSGDYSYALIYNPLHVIKEHKLQGSAYISEASYNALQERCIEISADDLDGELPPKVLQPKREGTKRRAPRADSSSRKRKMRRRGIPADV